MKTLKKFFAFFKSNDTRSPMEGILNIIIVIGIIACFSMAVSTVREYMDDESYSDSRSFMRNTVSEKRYYYVLSSYENSRTPDEKLDTDRVAAAKYIEAYYLKAIADKAGDSEEAKKQQDRMENLKSELGEYSQLPSDIESTFPLN